MENFDQIHQFIKKEKRHETVKIRRLSMRLLNSQKAAPLVSPSLIITLQKLCGAIFLKVISTIL